MIKQSMTSLSEDSKMSKFQKGLWGTLSALLLGIVLIIVEKLIGDWWDAEPIPPQEQTVRSPDVSKFDQEDRVSEVSDCQTIRTDDLNAQLKCLENPQASFTVSLWLDEPGKKRFNRDIKVSIGYKINGLYNGTPAYLTLLNISPTGQLAEIFSERVEAGKVYGQVTAQSHHTIVKHIELESGQEYFKAIATSEPIEWKKFLARASEGKPLMTFWGIGELMVDVD